MKKLLLLMIAGSFAAISAQAQTSFGLKGGLTAANVKFSGGGVTMSMKTKIGFYAGAMAEIGFAENFALQPELYFSALGSKADFTEFTSKLDLGYLNVPVLFKYRNNGFAAFAGPQIGFLMSAKSSAEGEKEDVKEDFKSTDFSGIVGVGYTLSNGFGLDARYQIGLSSIAKSTPDTEGVTAKNNAFMVGIHYFFNR